MRQKDERLMLGGGFSYLPTGEASGLIEGPDGSRAGVRLENSDGGPFIARLEKPGEQHWGVYLIGLPTAGRSPEDLTDSLSALLPKLRILYQRARVQ